jgi:hypothetical protein
LARTRTLRILNASDSRCNRDEVLRLLLIRKSANAGHTRIACIVRCFGLGPVGVRSNFGLASFVNDDSVVLGKVPIVLRLGDKEAVCYILGTWVSRSFRDDYLSQLSILCMHTSLVSSVMAELPWTSYPAGPFGMIAGRAKVEKPRVSFTCFMWRGRQANWGSAFLTTSRLFGLPLDTVGSVHLDVSEPVITPLYEHFPQTLVHGSVGSCAERQSWKDGTTQ